jgi:bifunctional non-homologous end joining protein LigD
VLDGEVVALGDAGRPSFGLLQRRMHVRKPPAGLLEEVPVSLLLFDVLWLDGELLIDEPQRQRRQRLDSLAVNRPPWVTSPVLDLPIDDLLETGRELGLEGFMLKRADAPYLPGRRSEAWSKVKLKRRREFVVGGWMGGRGNREGALGSLALGVWEGEPPRLRFMGMAGSGLTQADVEAFRRTAGELARASSPFAGPTPPGLEFLEPLLVAEVMFSEVTSAGTLRHPVLVGFRTDIDPEQVVADDELR